MQLLDAYLEPWLKSADIAPTSQETYRNGIDRFANWIVDNQHPVSTRTILAWREMLAETYKPATINVWLSSVRSFMTWLVENSIVDVNPGASVKGATRRGMAQKHKRDALSSAEMRSVIEQIDAETVAGKRDMGIVALMAFCALRQIEVQRASVGDLQTRGGRRILWVQGKGHREKDDYVVLPPIVEDVLNNWLAAHPTARTSPDEALFCSLSRRNYAKPMTTRSIRRIVTAAFSAAGIVGDSKTTHSLRHSAITSAIKNGAPITSVQAMARHTNINTTMIYFHEVERTENPAEDFVGYD